MPPEALIKTSQGALTAQPGVSVAGALDAGPVTVTNGDNTDVVEWSVWLLDAPSGSTTFPEGSLPLVLGADQTAIPLATFTPDAEGSYRLLLDVKDALGTVDRDIRCFGIADSWGVIRPACQKYPPPLPSVAAPGLADAPRPVKPDEQNYGGQSRGWAGTGQLDTFFERHGHLPPRRVAASAFSIPLGRAPLYLCDLPAVGAPMLLGLPASAPLGFVVRLGALGPSQHRVTVEPATGTIGGRAQLGIAAGSSATLVLVAPDRWEVLGGEERISERTLIAAVASSDSPVWKTVGATYWDPADALTSAATLHALLFTSDPSVAAQARLFHTASATEITGSLLSTPSVVPAQRASSIELTEGEGVYEFQLRRANSGAATALCLSAGLTVKEYRS